ncbi:MAG: GNAT family N-acetyltransferase [Pseudomonadota bacterium]
MTSNIADIGHVANLAALHAICFDGPARWSVDAFAEAATQPSCFFVPAGGEPSGFALGRVIANESELLTLVVAPHLRRSGLGRDLLGRFEAEARARGAAAAFLEVRADNTPALALYRSSGWAVSGTRRGYYEGIDALVLRKTL